MPGDGLDLAPIICRHSAAVRRRLRAVAGALLAVALVACGSTGPTIAPLPSPPVSRAPVTPAPVGSASLDPTACVPPSLEHCYSHDTMQAYADLTIKDVEAFYDQIYKAMPHPAAYIFVPTSKTATQGCIGVADDKSYGFCSADNKVYLGQEEEWYLYSNFGAVGPMVALAHEMGHHTQAQAGVPEPATPAQSIQLENQADCLAGAWVAWAADPTQQKLITIEYPKDLEHVADLMTAIASAESANRDHGTAVQRERSFDLGFGGTISACNAYYPDHPVYVTAPNPS